MISSGGVQVLNTNKRINGQNNFPTILTVNGSVTNGNNIFLSTIKPISSSNNNNSSSGGVGNLLIYSTTKGAKIVTGKSTTKPAPCSSIKADSECKPIIIYPKLNNGSSVNFINSIESNCTKRIKVEANDKVEKVTLVEPSSPVTKSIGVQNGSIQSKTCPPSTVSSTCTTPNNNVKKSTKSNIENCLPNQNTKFFGNKLCSSQLYHCDSLFFANVSPNLPDDIFETDDEDDLFEDIRLESPVKKEDSSLRNITSVLPKVDVEKVPKLLTSKSEPCGTSDNSMSLIYSDSSVIVNKMKCPVVDVSVPTCVVKCTPSKIDDLKPVITHIVKTKSKASSIKSSNRVTLSKIPSVQINTVATLKSDKLKLMETNQRKRKQIWRSLIKDIVQRRERINKQSKERIEKRKLLAALCQQRFASNWSHHVKCSEASNTSITITPTINSSIGNSFL